MYICLTILCSKLSDVHIQFELDKLTAVAYVNQMGDSKHVKQSRPNYSIPRVTIHRYTLDTDICPY
ncbi:hypothetical protein P5673_030162, partial [Acropora cervicornis]